MIQNLFVELSMFFHLRPLNNVASFSRYCGNANCGVPRTKGCWQCDNYNQSWYKRCNNIVSFSGYIPAYVGKEETVHQEVHPRVEDPHLYRMQTHMTMRRERCQWCDRVKASGKLGHGIAESSLPNNLVRSAHGTSGHCSSVDGWTRCWDRWMNANWISLVRVKSGGQAKNASPVSK